jgi:hypothetical protein
MMAIKRIIVEVEGGVVQTVYGDKLPDNIELDVVVRDWDNIKAGDPDPLAEEEQKESDSMITYW